MKILLTGGKGMLGRTLTARWRTEFEVVPTDLPEADITDADGFEKIVSAHRPDVVIHCAAMTAVDACETEPEKAFLLNETGSRNVARACAKNRVRLIAVSTDYVFRGDSSVPNAETDVPAPRTVYGKSKLAGEIAVRTECSDAVIARTAWLYGPGGPSFVHTMLKLADGSRPELKVVADQIGNPTSTFALADGLRQIVLHPDCKGVFHLTCEGDTSWYGFACEIFRLAGRNQVVVPCTTADYPRPAPRPTDSRLAKTALLNHGLEPMQPWREALKEFLDHELSDSSIPARG